MAAQRMTSSPWQIGGVPVLMYHDVLPEQHPEQRYGVWVESLRAELDWLHGEQIATASLDDLDLPGSKRRVVLTFDDGLERQYSLAFPLLRERAMRATFFVSSALIGETGYMSRTQLREMSAAGMTIGSHGREHVDHCALAGAAATETLRRSRMELEKITGTPVRTFSAPYGFVNRRVIAAAKQAGFEWICTSLPWLARGGTRVVPRLAIYAETGADEFAALVSGSPVRVLARCARHALLQVPKQCLRWLAPARLGVGRAETTR